MGCTYDNKRISLSINYINPYGEKFTMSSEKDFFIDTRSELDEIGDFVNTFLSQAGFVRTGDTMYMGSVTEEEWDEIDKLIKKMRGRTDVC